jgi:2-keto-3-deoxy-L-rhamnonate aldolase RhmA
MMIAACQKHGKIPGLLVQDIASAKEWVAKGIRLVPYSNDVNLLINAGSHAVSEIRKFAKAAK